MAIAVYEYTQVQHAKHVARGTGVDPGETEIAYRVEAASFYCPAAVEVAYIAALVTRSQDRVVIQRDFICYAAIRK